MGNELTAGRELDALVAEKVMGWAPRDAGAGDRLIYVGAWAHCESLPHYSTDIAAAWQVVEKLAADGLYVHVGYCLGRTEASVNSPLDIIDNAYAPTAPLAICLAALKALEGGAR